jgi:hypothetical protein
MKGFIPLLKNHSGDLAMTRFQAIFSQFNLLRWMQMQFDRIEIHNAQVARLLCQLIPAQCPFERDFKFKGHTILHIPPLCKLNPLYEQLVSLRFKCLSYLVDECGEDLTSAVSSRSTLAQ